MDESIVVAQTKAWIEKVVIGCNFCPFASKVFLENSIRYSVIEESHPDCYKKPLMQALNELDAEDSISTTLIVFSDAYSHFNGYMAMINKANKLLRLKQYEGIYQIASFHPEYLFQESYENDPANYTNRSPFPMIHLLREQQVEKALQFYKNADDIPQNNIRYAQINGLLYMQRLLNSVRQ